MTRTHSFAPALGLAALAALSLAMPAYAQKIAVTVTDLHPVSGFFTSTGRGISGSAQVGQGDTTANGDVQHALLWRGTAGSVVDLHPTGFGPYPTAFDYSQAFGVSGNTQVGAFYSDYGTNYAVLWHGTADSIVSLDNDYSSFNTGSAAFAASGDAQVGYTSNQFYDDEPQNYTAVLWHGTADSAVGLGAGAYKLYNTLAYGISGNTQVGIGFNYDDGYVNALLWHGTSDSVVDLNPAGYLASYAYGTSGDTQVGNAFLNNSIQHAALWRGTAASFVDLNPAGFALSQASAVSGETQVGNGQKTLNSASAALLWRSTAKSVLDLNQFLPDASSRSSIASGVDDHDGVVNVVGTSNAGAVIWRVIFAPTLNRISQTQRPAGSKAFSLTAKGMRFTHQSFINWNGKRLPTTFQNSEHLQTVVPAALVAHSGTAAVTVSTPGVDTSQSKAFTIR